MAEDEPDTTTDAEDDTLEAALADEDWPAEVAEDETDAAADEEAAEVEFDTVADEDDPDAEPAADEEPPAADTEDEDGAATAAELDETEGGDAGTPVTSACWYRVCTWPGVSATEYTRMKSR